jgi:hypothetical protein
MDKDRPGGLEAITLLGLNAEKHRIWLNKVRAS